MLFFSELFRKSALLIFFLLWSKLFTPENYLPIIEEVNVDLVNKCLQQLHLLAMHFEILGHISGLLNGLDYLRRTRDLNFRVLRIVLSVDIYQKILA